MVHEAHKMSGLIRHSFAALAIAALGGVATGSHVVAQQLAPKAPAAPKAAPKAAPNAQQKAPAAAGQQPAQAQQPPQPQFTFSPWTKVCQQPGQANARKICFTGRDGRIEAGMPVVAAVVIEAEGESKKILRITLPLGMALQPGTRVVIDEGQPITAPYLFCIPNGCLADYEASQDLIDHMKKGRGLALQGVNGNGQFITVTLPLADFAKAHDGPPMSEKEFEELQRRLQQPRTSGVN
jgi:invasion protein IalB